MLIYSVEGFLYHNYISLFIFCQVMINNISVAGIVAEYNPFHFGHAHHLNETKKICDAVVAVMSGNFVQRCEPAVCDKYVRAKMAVLGGVDLVLGLPVRFATGSAEKFAYGAVSVLASLGFVDTLSFGSESADIENIVKTANRIDAISPEEYKEAMRGGLTFADARARLIGSEHYEPNDILAVEYVRAIKKLGCGMRPFAVKRTDGYLESATSLREKIFKGDLSGLPDHSAELLKKEIAEGRAPGNIKNIERTLLGFVRNADRDAFKNIYGVNEKEGFDGRIISALQASSLDELYSLIKTKRYTMATVKRAILSSYLRIKNEQPAPVPFVHVLAFSEKGRQLIRAVPSDVTVVTNISKIKEIYSEFADEERRATDLFTLSTPEIGAGFGEYTRKFQ
ncbi:MAG: nucleotidyltransferase family protein [Ruminococcaceae bacterium]|nr:nucleotidyltransferase family protein [Oscillospiraceae bacterium]